MFHNLPYVSRLVMKDLQVPANVKACRLWHSADLCLKSLPVPDPAKVFVFLVRSRTHHGKTLSSGV